MPRRIYPPDAKADHIASKIQGMTEHADNKVCCADFDIPIEGMVLRFDSFSYSATLGRTGHHYNDGIVSWQPQNPYSIYGFRLQPIKQF